MTDFERRHCYQKFKYDTRKEAKRAAKVMNKRYPRETFVTYPCQCCGFFHVGREKTEERIEMFRRAA